MKKGCLIALGVLAGLAVLAGIGIFFAFRATAPLVESGEKFVSTFAAGKHAEAYAMTSATLQSAQSEPEFTRIVSSFGLDGYQSASWSNRSIENDRGALEGTVTTANGGKVPLRMEFVKEGGTWKLTGIRGEATGAKDGGSAAAARPAKAEVPDAKEAAKLAEESLLKFDEAVQEKSFNDFHGYISKVWQQQITPEKLGEIFKAFVDQEISLKGIKNVEPVFDTAPAVNDDGVLVLTGHYPTKPSRVDFTLKYLADGNDWKLVGINVNVKASETE